MFTAKLRAIIPIAAAAILAATATLPVAADTSGSMQLRIPIAIYSLTVGPSGSNFGLCQQASPALATTGLTFPNGTCKAPLDSNGNLAYVTITNTGNASNIDVQSSGLASPIGGVTPWAVCAPLGNCSGANSALPGIDQFAIYTENGTEHSVVASSACDTALAMGEPAVPRARTSRITSGSCSGGRPRRPTPHSRSRPR